MDRPETTSASPPAGSSAAPQITGTPAATQVPLSQNVGNSGSSPAPGPSSESPAPTPHPLVPETQGTATLQQSPVQISVPLPVPQHEATAATSAPATSEASGVQPEPPREPPPIQRPPETTAGSGTSPAPAQHTLEPMTSDARARRLTDSTLGGNGVQNDSSAPSGAPPAGQHTLEPIPGTGARPATGSTLGSPGIPELHRASDPPTPPPRPFLPQLRMGRSTSAGVVTSSAERLGDMDTFSGFGQHDLGRDSGMRLNQTLPILPSQVRLADPGAPRRQRTLDGYGSNTGHGMGRRSGIDWAVPVTATEDLKRKRTVSERLAPTIANAKEECIKYKARARMTGLALNAAIGLQVLLGAITTGLSAVATAGAKSTAVQTTVFGHLYS